MFPGTNFNLTSSVPLPSFNLCRRFCRNCVQRQWLWILDVCHPGPHSIACRACRSGRVRLGWRCQYVVQRVSQDTNNHHFNDTNHALHIIYDAFRTQKFSPPNAALLTGHPNDQPMKGTASAFMFRSKNMFFCFISDLSEIIISFIRFYIRSN